MELRAAAQHMIKSFPGGWTAMAAAMGLSPAGLENRVYERKGQSLSVHESLQMQAFADTSHFAEAIAAASGGVFLKLPELGDIDNEELLAKFNRLYAELGRLSARFSEATADGVIDGRERAELKGIGDQVHKIIEELLFLTFRLFCAPDSKGEQPQTSREA